MNLFRPEAIAANGQRLHGHVNLTMPVSWLAITFLIGALTVVGLIFAGLATFANSTAVDGTITTDLGLARVIPSRAGTIRKIYVSEGQYVRVGQPLVALQVDNKLEDGSSEQGAIAQALERQGQQIAEQARQERLAGAIAVARTAADGSALRTDLANIDRQMTIAIDLERAAKRELDQAQTLSARGFISAHDLDEREAAWLARQQQILQLQSTRDAKAAQVASLGRQAQETSLRSGALQTSLSIANTEIRQRETGALASTLITIPAAVSGRVAGLNLSVGDSVAPDRQILSIVPDGSRVNATLHVPASAVGFLDPGDTVHLQVDAFPYQRFGTIEGNIISISGAAIPVDPRSDGSATAYLVKVAIPAPRMIAYGHSRPLMPGMSLKARIITRRQSLFRWLFDPIFAVSKR